MTDHITSTADKKDAAPQNKPQAAPAKDSGSIRIIALSDQPYDVGGTIGTLKKGKKYRVSAEVARVLTEAGVAEKANKEND